MLSSTSSCIFVFKMISETKTNWWVKWLKIVFVFEIIVKTKTKAITGLDRESAHPLQLHAAKRSCCTAALSARSSDDGFPNPTRHNLRITRGIHVKSTANYPWVSSKHISRTHHCTLIRHVMDICPKRCTIPSLTHELCSLHFEVTITCLLSEFMQIRPLP